MDSSFLALLLPIMVVVCQVGESCHLSYIEELVQLFKLVQYGCIFYYIENTCIS